MADVADEVRAGRTSPGLFDLSGAAGPSFARGVIDVRGRDAPRWLDGMITNDVKQIAHDGARNGCYAALLTTKGRIVADLHVLAREHGYWLETAAAVTDDVIDRLQKYIVADDVDLADASPAWVRLGVEGPGSTAMLASTLDDTALADVPAAGWTAGSIAGVASVLARFGWSGEDAWQLFVPTDGATAVRDALTAAGATPRSTEALEVLRVEAGIPRLGPELGEEIFPDEARLDAAISRTKGCYTGQEIVARLFSRGAVNHLLVGLRFEGEAVPAGEAKLYAPGAAGAREKATGEVTSACVSPTAGVIGLGYARREHAEPGTALVCRTDAGEMSATVAALPLVERAAGE